MEERRLIERMHDRQGSVVGFVGLPGGFLAITAAAVMWLVEPRRGSGWFVAITAVGMVGLALVVVAAVIAAQAEYRIARAENVSRARSVGRALRVVVGFVFQLP